MARTRKQAKTSSGFAIPLQFDTELGLEVLVAEDEKSHDEPVAVASTISQTQEIAENDFRGRMQQLERAEDPGICIHIQASGARQQREHLRVCPAWPEGFQFTEGPVWIRRYRQESLGSGQRSSRHSAELPRDVS